MNGIDFSLFSLNFFTYACIEWNKTEADFDEQRIDFVHLNCVLK